MRDITRRYAPRELGESPCHDRSHSARRGPVLESSGRPMPCRLNQQRISTNPTWGAHLSEEWDTDERFVLGAGADIVFGPPLLPMWFDVAPILHGAEAVNALLSLSKHCSVGRFDVMLQISQGAETCRPASNSRSIL
jgi:hypothetical protein